MASSSGSHSNDEAINVEGLTKWPLTFVAETKEYVCGCCGQLLISSHNTEDLETHFKSCKQSAAESGLLTVKDGRKLERNVRVLNAEISEMKNRMETMEREVAQEVKAGFHNLNAAFEEGILALETRIQKQLEKKNRERNDGNLLNKIEALEEQMREMGVAQEVKMAEVNGKISEVNGRGSGIKDIPSPTVVHSVLEEVKGQELTSSTDPNEPVSEQTKSGEKEIETVKRQVANEGPKNESRKKMKCFRRLEPPPSHRMTRIPMNCYNLVTFNHQFQPSYKWTIDGIKNKMEQKTFEMSSEMFQWNSYLVKARAKLQLKEDDNVYLSLCLEDNNNRIYYTVVPQVFYLLKSRDSRHKCNSVGYLIGSSLTSSLTFQQCCCHKSWLKNCAYNVDDSIEIEIHVESGASPMAQRIHSYDGTLVWNIRNYARRLQLEKDGLVLYQESPYFCTGPRGYRVHVKLFLNGYEEKGLIACVMFVAGKFDAQLPMSFAHSTTVTLINRKEPERSVTKTIVEDIKNEKFYDLEICKVEEVEKLIEKDTLFCKVVIKAL